MAILDEIRKRKGGLQAAVYARYSSDMQREESIEAQLRAVSFFAEKEKIEIVGFYIDRAKSATTAMRPELQRMLIAAESRTFDIVLVHKLDRFARNRYDSIVLREELKKSNVIVLSVIENLDGSPESLILESVLEGMNEYYSRNLAREIEKGKTENAYQGKHNGGIAPLGYNVIKETGQLVINEDEAEIVRYIFDRVANRVSYKALLTECRARGWKSKVGGELTVSSLYTILRNEKYIGVYVYNKSAPKAANGKRNGHSYKNPDEVIRVIDAIPPILDSNLFATVQEQLDRRRVRSGEGRAKRLYLLSGKLICAYCGARMVGNTRNPIKRTTPYSSYRCGSRQKGIKCECREVNKEMIEHRVLSALADTLLDDNASDKIVALYEEHLKANSLPFQAHKKSLQTRKCVVSKEINNLVQALADGGSNSVLKRINELETEQERLNSLIIEMVELEKNRISEQEIRKRISLAREQLRSGSLSCMKRIVDETISYISVSNERIDIFLTFWSRKNLAAAPRGAPQGYLESQPLRRDVFGGEGATPYTNTSDYLYVIRIVREPVQNPTKHRKLLNALFRQMDRQ